MLTEFTAMTMMKFCNTHCPLFDTCYSSPGEGRGTQPKRWAVSTVFWPTHDGLNCVLVLVQNGVYQYCRLTHFQVWLTPASSSASHTDVAHLAARVLLGIGCGQAHKLVVPADLLHGALIQVNRLREKHLKDDVASMAVERLLPRMLGVSVCQEGVGGQVEQWETGATEVVSFRANRGQNQHHIVIGCIHTVEVGKVQVDVGVQQVSSWDLEAQGAIWGVFGREACIKLCVAADKDSVQFAIDGRTMTPTAVFKGRTHQASTCSP